jgi:putative hydrolase of the HAD superfamily
MIRVVTFDAAGTLIQLIHPPGRTYAETARQFGYRLDPDRVQEAFRIAWKALAPPPESDGPHLDDDRGWWRQLVAETMSEAGYRIDPFEKYFVAVYQAFAGPGVWELLPGVPTMLTELARLKIRLGVISNFDRRLYEILALLGIRNAFEEIIISSEIGVRKPASRIFRLAAQRFQVEAHEILHVGDEPDSDFAGARRAGLEALLIDRQSSTLANILPWLAQQSAPGGGPSKFP